MTGLQVQRSDSKLRPLAEANSGALAAEAGAAYVFERPAGGTVWSRLAYLKASNTDAGDSFGYAVALTPETVVVGAWSEASNATGVNGVFELNSSSKAFCGVHDRRPLPQRARRGRP